MVLRFTSWLKSGEIGFICGELGPHATTYSEDLIILTSYFINIVSQIIKKTLQGMNFVCILSKSEFTSDEHSYLLHFLLDIVLAEVLGPHLPVFLLPA